MSQPKSIFEARWLPVPGYEGYYEVSDFGHVRSVDRVITTKAGVRRRVPGRLLKPGLDSHGYLHVVLHNGTPGPRLVHHLVLAAFVGPKPSGMTVVTRHLNGNRQDPRLWNLAYGNQSENMRDRFLHATGRSPK